MANKSLPQYIFENTLIAFVLCVLVAAACFNQSFYVLFITFFLGLTYGVASYYGMSRIIKKIDDTVNFTHDGWLYIVPMLYALFAWVVVVFGNTCIALLQSDASPYVWDPAPIVIGIAVYAVTYLVHLLRSYLQR